MEDTTELPAFLTQPVGERSNRIELKTVSEAREHCLARGPSQYNHIVIILRGREFRYTIRTNKNPSAGWHIEAIIPSYRKKLHPGKTTARKINRAQVGHITAALRFLRRGKSLPDDDPIIKAFIEFYELIFVRQVMRPLEMKVEAIIPMKPSE